MESDVQMKGIGLKTVTEDDEKVTKFVVKVEVVLDSFDDAVEVAKKIKKELEDLLNGQTKLAGFDEPTGDEDGTAD